MTVEHRFINLGFQKYWMQNLDFCNFYNCQPYVTGLATLLLFAYRPFRIIYVYFTTPSNQQHWSILPSYIQLPPARVGLEIYVCYSLVRVDVFTGWQPTCALSSFRHELWRHLGPCQLLTALTPQLPRWPVIFSQANYPSQAFVIIMPEGSQISRDGTF